MKKEILSLKEPFTGFVKELQQHLRPEQICIDKMNCIAWGVDASAYQIIPRVVIHTKNEDEISLILKSASRRRINITFRAAGTSLSGQAITNSVLVIAGKNWENHKVSADGSLIELQPGITGGRIHEILAPYHRKFSPDPASIESAMLGGIVANNASGMRCGIHANSDRMMVSAKIILGDGTVLDTASKDSRINFEQTHPVFLKEIKKIQSKIIDDLPLLHLLSKKYHIKNVTGLNLLPFLAYKDPFDVIAHLQTGSEGTLAFLASATFKTEIIKPCQACGLFCFSSLYEACSIVKKLKTLPISAIELLDRRALLSIQEIPSIPSFIRLLDENATALLIETEAQDQNHLEKQIDEIKNVLAEYSIVNEIPFSQEKETIDLLWRLRAGIFPTVGGLREPGTTCLIEDIAFPIEELPEAATSLRKLIDQYEYKDGVIYGHALEGNLHFIINQRFDTAKEVKRYESLMRDVVKLVTEQFHGSLKAEHGTGRNMAPFVKKEWGEKVWNIMKEVKDLFDPLHILNQGVIFNEDPYCFLKNFKQQPITNPLIDKCIECGFCEKNCVTAGLTLSARQRIVITRELAKLRKLPNKEEITKQIEHDFKYAGIQTCAGDGLCATSCPMGINTGELIHASRANINANHRWNQHVGNWSAKHLSIVKGGVRSLLYAADVAHQILGDANMGRISSNLRKISNHKIPLWNTSLPTCCHIPKLPLENNLQKEKVVYFPSCINQTFGKAKEDKETLSQKFVTLLNRAGYEVVYPQKIGSLCCGMIWESKGFPETSIKKCLELENALLDASKNGLYSIVCDQSPCIYQMRKHFTKIKIYETCEFINQFLMDRLTIYRQKEIVAIHMTCSTRKMNLTSDIISLAKRCSQEVFIPEEIGCCGFAGDMGFNHPEVNSYALRKLKSQINNHHVAEGYSNSRTCEIGLTVNSGIPYKSIIYLVEECTKPQN